MPSTNPSERPLWPITLAAIYALIYFIIDLVVGIKVLQLPNTLSQMPFPYNIIAQAPQVQTFSNWAGNILLILSACFFLGGIGVFLKKRWGLYFMIFAAIGQIVSTIYVGYSYYTKAFPVLQEIFLFAGPPANAWMYDITGVVFFSEMSTLLPQLILIFTFLLSSPKKFLALETKG
jgi:hypothetical protein